MISVLVPYAPAGVDRDLAWAWNQRRLLALVARLDDEAELKIGVPNVVGDPAIFQRSLALNRAAEGASGDVFLICDADTTYEDPADFARVVEVAEKGGWTLPQRYVRIGPGISRLWMEGEPVADPPRAWANDVQQEYPFANSGVVCLPRAAFEAIDGFDERFKGWGGEDDAMRAALETLWAPPTRLGTALHLYHPRPPEHSSSAPHTAASFVLADRYGSASGDREAMLALLAEDA